MWNAAGDVLEPATDGGARLMTMALPVSAIVSWSHRRLNMLRQESATYGTVIVSTVTAWGRASARAADAAVMPVLGVGHVMGCRWASTSVDGAGNIRHRSGRELAWGADLGGHGIVDRG